MLTRTTSARRKVTFVSLVELELFVCEVLEEGIYITGLMSRKIGLLQTRVAKTEAVGGEGPANVNRSLYNVTLLLRQE